ncbi:NERD domain-containing protein [Mycoplasmopsis citelli]|uniref:nuclease-related domain-containing protein n=1 Tax=Mycoplasmopsis citelli TaxID=171281 RepID=UPI0021146831|nr:nuclease-related domain-containing protein [Mycoplasmopsis citelli]UUD35914.1 NERD domain-containing protein [Mycoplasmopsis citelli]
MNIKSFFEENQVMQTPTNESFLPTIISIVVILALLAIIFPIVLVNIRKQNKKKSIGFKFEEEANYLVKAFAGPTFFTHIGGAIYSYDSKMYEVDGLLVSDSLIVVIEYKAFNGTISGDGAGEYVYLTSNNKRKAKFKNPILQNEKHIQHLWNTIGKKIPVGSLIIFPDNVKFNISNLDNHVILSHLSDVPANILMLHQASASLPPVTNSDHILNALKMMKIKTRQENKEFQKMINKEKNV